MIKDAIKYFLFFILVVVIVGGLLWYVYAIFFSPPKELTKVVFGPKWVNQAQFAGVFVAKDLGYYEKEGIDVTIEEFESGDSVMEDLRIGKIDLGLMSANEFLLNYSQGEDIQALAAFYQVSPYVVASLKSQAVSSPAELKGKRLGIKGGNGAEATVVYHLLLNSANISDDEVSFITLPLGASEKDDLVAERTDVIGFYRTRLYQFDKEGVSYQLLYPEKHGAALYNDVLVARTSFIENNPEAVEAFIKATIDGWKFAFDNQDETIAITLRYVTEDAYKDIDYERYILREAEKMMLPKGNIADLGMMDYERWNRFYVTLLEKGFLNNEVDITQAFTTEFLP